MENISGEIATDCLAYWLVKNGGAKPDRRTKAFKSWLKDAKRSCPENRSLVSKQFDIPEALVSLRFSDIHKFRSIKKFQLN